MSVKTQWTHTQPDPTLDAEAFPDNYGVVLRDDILVIDVDPKNFSEGDDPWLRLKTDLGMKPGEEFDTYTVSSQKYRQSAHVYFRKPKGVNLQTRVKKYGKGIEVKTYGSYLVGPGSTHPDTGKPYVVVHGRPEQLMDAPQYILTEWGRQSRSERSGKGVVEYVDSPENRKKYINFLASRDPAVEGMNGDQWTFLTAAAGRDIGLPEQATFDLMMEFFNPKCAPPWTEKELAKKVANAYMYAKDEIGNLNAEAVFDPVEPPKNDIKVSDAHREWQIKIDRKAADKKANIIWKIRGSYDPKSLDEPELRNSLVNVINFFQRPHHGMYQNPFYRLVRYNVFTKNIEFTRSAPWHTAFHKVKYWSDDETGQFRAWLSAVRDFEAPEKLVLDGVIVAAQFRKYHPLLDYYNGLKWDGVPRIDKLMSYYCGAEDNIYTREVGRRIMIALIARIMVPAYTGEAAKHDHLLVLEGAQGTGKSTFCDILGGGYYADMHIDPHNKDSMQGQLGKHVIELSEMTYNRRSDVEAMKQFLSRKTDWLRLPYGKMFQDIPRQSIFIATTNELAGYMRDQTGNRRMWPVRTHEFRNAELKADRDQLFAEALYAWRAGEVHYFTDENVIEAAMCEQSRRAEVDIWVEAVELWLEREKKQGRLHPRLTTINIAEEILNIPARQIDRAITMRISNTMQAMRWDSVQIRNGKHILRGYKNPNYKTDLDDLVRGI